MAGAAGGGAAVPLRGMNVFVAATGKDSEKTAGELVPVGKSVGKVVAPPVGGAAGGAGLVSLRLRHLAPPSGGGGGEGGGGGGEGGAVTFVAVDKENAGTGGGFKVTVEVPEWWRPEWITDACQ